MANRSFVPRHVDTLGGRYNHELANAPGGAPVRYSGCTRHLHTIPDTFRELGFHTFYMNQDQDEGFTDGADILGVIGDSTMKLQRDLSPTSRADGLGGGTAPHGSQYYVMEFTGGFVYVDVDPVSISRFAEVEMVCWVRFEKVDWQQYPDALVVLAYDPQTKAERVLLAPFDAEPTHSQVRHCVVADLDLIKPSLL